MRNKILLVWGPGSGVKPDEKVLLSLSFPVFCSAHGLRSPYMSPPGLPGVVLLGHTHAGAMELSTARGQGEVGGRDLTPCYHSCGYFSFSRYLLSTCCVPEPMQSTGDTKETETDFLKILALV